MFCTIGSDGKGNIKHLFMCMCVCLCVRACSCAQDVFKRVLE